MRDLRAEMGDVSVPDPKARKAAEIKALQSIVTRMELADAARAQGLEKTPDFALQKERVIDNLLVETMQRRVLAQMPQPTPEEAVDFMNANPDIFRERKIFAVDQIRMPRPSDPSVLKSLEPLKTLEQISDVLKTDNIPFQRGAGALDAVGADPRAVQAIVNLPPGELFVIPGPQGLLVNQITGTKVVPFTGDPAQKYAMQLLTKQRAQETVGRAFRQIIASASKNVQFNKEYNPATQAPVLAPPPAPKAPGKS